jgi:D-glycero-D-manno-heptose 1,7-bisphosphate phosphatase
MKLVVLDRDGVINVDSDDYIRSPDEWRPIPGSLDAIAALTRAGYRVAVATNQSGLARGYFDDETLQAIHRKMQRMVTEAGGRIDDIAWCPHGPDDGCDCRKPAPGLLRQLERRVGRSLRGVPVIGDSLRDLEAAASVGAAPMLVRTGKGAATEASLPASLAATPVFDDLAAAVASVLGTGTC